MGKWLVALVLAVASVAGLAAGPARAQGIEVTAQDVANSFPDEIVFRLSASSDPDIQEVTVRYEILPDGVPAYGVPQFEPGGQVQVDFHLDANDGQLYLAPGAEILYHWEIEDAAGNTLSTEPATFVYQDTRYDWVSASEGNVSVHWYGGGDAESYLRVARDTLDRMAALRSRVPLGQSPEEFEAIRRYFRNPLRLAPGTCQAPSRNLVVDVFGNVSHCFGQPRTLLPSIGTVPQGDLATLWRSAVAQHGRRRLATCTLGCGALLCHSRSSIPTVEVAVRVR